MLIKISKKYSIILNLIRKLQNKKNVYFYSILNKFNSNHIISQILSFFNNNTLINSNYVQIFIEPIFY